ncbi:MAG: 16S rRNA (cytidine(1402)-2'-O)-methyltransferase [Synergistaceae bacterium]|jgi:16S rRNA (cytidine1402-2'-O)-methyltransferase|nr:16S rRNA (cytidine(1402)-2'-O)-methyltransferase [Synergistaceae bacterium]
MPLIVVPTPVGNLGDMTLRGLEALKSADVIACEDTRRTLKLLNFYGIRKPLVSYHRHNERARADEMMACLERGDVIALVSDAGTPGLSDPGGVLISLALSRGVPVDVLPGANALLPALLMSGISADRFMFVGFPDGGRDTREFLGSLRNVGDTLIFYIAPHDLTRFIADAREIFGDRRAAIVREISKVHQESARGTLAELERAAASREMKGEIVFVVEGASPEDGANEDPGEWKMLAGVMQKSGIYDKMIANVLFESYGIPRNQVKSFLLENDR